MLKQINYEMPVLKPSCRYKIETKQIKLILSFIWLEF